MKKFKVGDRVTVLENRSNGANVREGQTAVIARSVDCMGTCLVSIVYPKGAMVEKTVLACDLESVEPVTLPIGRSKASN